VSTDIFNKVIRDLLAIHETKSHDYGATDDPYGNFRPAIQYGVEPWIGCLIRMGDKTARIQSFLKKGTLLNESVEDALWDQANYAIIALCLYLESKPKPKGLTALQSMDQANPVET
jgi:hypothetical protein